MDYVFIIASIVAFSIQTLCFKEFNRSFMKNLRSYFLFNFLYFGIVVLLLSYNTRPGDMHTATVVLACCFGALFILTMLLLMKAMEHGALSYTSLLYSFSILIPVLFGIFLWKEKANMFQLAGLFLFLVTFYLSSELRSDLRWNINFKWLLFCISALICNGVLMTILKAHQMLLPGKESREFLLTAFGVASVLSFLLFLHSRSKAEETVSHLKKRMFLLLVLAAGITTAYGNLAALYLSGRIPAIIQFPAVNGGIVLFSSAFSVFVYGEKLTFRKSAGLVMGLGALVLLSMRYS